MKMECCAWFPVLGAGLVMLMMSQCTRGEVVDKTKVIGGTTVNYAEPAGL